MIGILVKKVAGCVFDSNYFDADYFEVNGWGWVGNLVVKAKLVGLLKIKGD